MMTMQRSHGGDPAGGMGGDERAHCRLKVDIQSQCVCAHMCVQVFRGAFGPKHPNCPGSITILIQTYMLTQCMAWYIRIRFVRSSGFRMYYSVQQVAGLH